uniref:Secreted protein n=1 Tax=Oryza brachyantha TaxID=4533 RepID=J3LM77_ORYBR
FSQQLLLLLLSPSLSRQSRSRRVRHTAIRAYRACVEDSSSHHLHPHLHRKQKQEKEEEEKKKSTGKHTEQNRDAR